LHQLLKIAPSMNTAFIFIFVIDLSDQMRAYLGVVEKKHASLALNLGQI